jgi:hypothetical protein
VGGVGNGREEGPGSLVGAVAGSPLVVDHSRRVVDDPPPSSLGEAADHDLEMDLGPIAAKNPRARQSERLCPDRQVHPFEHIHLPGRSTAEVMVADETPGALEYPHFIL